VRRRAGDIELNRPVALHSPDTSPGAGGLMQPLGDDLKRPRAYCNVEGALELGLGCLCLGFGV